MYIQALKMLIPAIRSTAKNIKYGILVLLGLLIMIGFSVAFNKWNAFFYNAIQAYDNRNVWLGIIIFCILAIIYVIIYGLTSYYTRFLEFGIRESLYDKYKLLVSSKPNILNRDQRLQEDTLRFSRTILSLIKAIVDAAIKLPLFLIILMSNAELWMVGIVLVYCIVGTFGSRKVAKKLVLLENEQESREARLRRNVIMSIEEHYDDMPTLDEVKQNWVLLAIRNKWLSYYTSLYGQISIIIPYIMLLPLYLNHTILLGVLFQTAGAIDKIFTSLSVFVDSRDIMVDLQMVTKRLKELD